VYIGATSVLYLKGFDSVLFIFLVSKKYKQQTPISSHIQIFFQAKPFMFFKEDFLSFIWQFRLFRSNQLSSTCGDRIEVIETGFANRNAGPDFSNAKIKIGSTLWVGNVEIHLRSSDWRMHGHTVNTAYDNVILHVVYEEDLRVVRTNGSAIHTLVVKDQIPPGLIDRYLALINARARFPCEPQIREVDPLVLHSCFSRILMERFEHKYRDVCLILENNKGNWEATCYQLLARSFGFKTNSLPFEMLANTIDHQLFSKYNDNPIQIEALIFGQAGFLQGEFLDSYPRQLQGEYWFLQKKLNIHPMDSSVWKFLRMRPASFPTMRLAQFAGLMIKSQRLFASILEARGLVAVRSIFEQLPVHSYWSRHFHFTTPGLPASTELGKASIESIIINGVCLLLFSYGKYIDQPMYMDQAFSILEQLRGENNSIIAPYRESGIKIENAFISQALLELNKSYCSKKKCLNCGIGVKILRK
jgi:hypothetical protein